MTARYTRRQTPCDVCGAKSLRPYRKRTDGLSVLRCDACGMGVLEAFPASTQDLYGDSYYFADAEKESGYADYGYVAAHATTWAACLLRLLVPSGNVLDVGCADGHLLSRLPDAYRRYGIEVNPAMADACVRREATIIAPDLLQPGLVDRYRDFFDGVTAIAVFEHLDRFRDGFASALGMLRPDGFLLFEVPLCGEGADEDVWFRSSLEHLYYPSASSLRHLVETILGFPLAGGPVHVDGFGSNFIGIVPRDLSRRHVAEQLWLRVAGDNPDGEMSAEEAYARFQLRVVHAARTTAEDVALLGKLPASAMDGALMRRMADLWSRDLDRLSSAKRFLRKMQADSQVVEEARARDAVQYSRKDTAIEELQAELRRLHGKSVKGKNFPGRGPG